MKAKPLLSYVQTTRVKFDPGDRILVRVSTDLSSAQENKLRKSINKFAENDVRILFINCLKCRLLRKRGNGLVERLADETYAEYQPENMGIANISCSKIDFQDGDQLILMDHAFTNSVNFNNKTLIKKHLKQWLQRWVGDNVEVIIAEGTRQ